MQAMKADKIFIGKGAKDYQVINLPVLRGQSNILGNLLGGSNYQCSRVGMENLMFFWFASLWEIKATKDIVGFYLK